MRILFVIDHLGLGGAQVVLRDIAQELAVTGLSVSVLPLFPSKNTITFNKEIKKLDLFEPLLTDKIYSAPNLRPFQIYNAIKPILKDSYDVINSHLYVATIICSLHSYAKTQKHFSTIHSHWEITALAPQLSSFVAAVTGSKFISLFPGVTKQLHALGIAKNKISELSLSSKNLDEVSRSSIRDTNFDPDILYISSRSRFHKQRRLTHLIRAAHHLNSQSDKNFFVKLVGSGPQELKLKSLISQLNLNQKIEMASEHGFTSEFPKSSVAYSLSVNGDLGLAGLEWLARGVPLVCWDLGKRKTSKTRSAKFIHYSSTVSEMVGVLRDQPNNVDDSQVYAAKNWIQENHSWSVFLAGYKKALNL